MDVAIIGGGFTGVAAAYFLRRRFPEKRIIVLESEFVGYGSSGRNTGMAISMLGNSVLPLISKYGKDRTTLLHRLARQAVSLTEGLIEEHGIDCDYETPGRLILARNSNALRLLEKEARACEEVGARATFLDRDDSNTWFGALESRAALHMPEDGMLNPVKLLRGMAEVVESLGVEVYENSRCSHVETGPVVSIFTALGQVRAKNVVIATNAYANPLGLLQQRVLPLYVYNVVTEPLTDTRMQSFHWEGRYAVFDARHLFWNLRPTADNRLVFIEVDARYFYDVSSDYSHRPREFRRHRTHLLELFPFLGGTKFTHQWGGRVAMTLDFLPSIGRTGEHRNVFYSLGYNGHGLAFAHLAGKMLAGLFAEEVSELTRNLLVDRRSWSVPSPFLRYAATNAYKLCYKLGDRIDDFRR